MIPNSPMMHFTSSQQSYKAYHGEIIVTQVEKHDKRVNLSFPYLERG